MVPTNPLTEQFINQVVLRLGENKRVRRNLPHWGRIHIDRQLPFLCIYRRPANRQDEGTDRLITGQPAYLAASGRKSLVSDLSQLVENTVRTIASAFGSFLIIEIWSEREVSLQDTTESISLHPAFDIMFPKQANIPNTVDVLEKELGAIEIHQAQSDVKIVRTSKPHPPHMSPLLSEAMAEELGCTTIGIRVRPIYRHAATGEILPLIHQTLMREFNQALQQTFFTFAHTQTKYRPAHYQMLGRRAMVKAVWTIDKQLATIERSFDFLLQVTPVNADKAWAKFKRQRFQQLPIFRYRPRTVDPALLKRELWNIRIERVEDPTLQHLFREKRKELDTQISMLGDINRDKFLYGSMQLYGDLNTELIASAKELLAAISPHSREQNGRRTLSAAEFAKMARTQIEQYREVCSDFSAEVHIQSNITGLMVSHGNLLVGDKVKISESRAEALISHEIGIHIVTYFNGQAQPFKLLSSGLAGYEELQEGLAVLAEYLVGGLSKPRLRLLAARVIAADSLIDGATFVDTFRLLVDTHHFKQRTAFNIVMRIYRAGGLTKDAVYLRGLILLLHHLQDNALSDLFFIGKIAIDHIPIIQELQRRKVIQPPKLHPHFLNVPKTVARLERLGHKLSIINLIESEKK